jgi:hypothetical protein
VLHVARRAQHQTGDVADRFGDRPVATHQRLFDRQLVQSERGGDRAHRREVGFVQAEPDERPAVMPRLPGRVGEVHAAGSPPAVEVDGTVHDGVGISAPACRNGVFGPGEAFDEPAQRTGEELGQCRLSPPGRATFPRRSEHPPPPFAPPRARP